MKRKLSLIFAIFFTTICLTACGGGGGGSGDSIKRTSQLKGTGFSASGDLLSNVGQADGNWLVLGQGNNKPAVLLTPDGPNWWYAWVPNSSTSQWIGAKNVTDPGAAPYSFEQTFDLGDLDPTRTRLVGLWAIDDNGTLEINGIKVAELTEGYVGEYTNNYSRLNDIVIQPGTNILRSGENVIKMTVTDTDNYLAGARFEGRLEELVN